MDIPFPVSFSVLEKWPLLLCGLQPDFRDHEDRPIMESRSCQYSIDKSEYAICKYKDSRKGTSINLSAYNHMLKNFDGIVDIIKKISSLVKYNHQEKDLRAQFSIVSLSLFFLPKYRLLMNLFTLKKGGEVAIHSGEAAIYKIGHGLYTLCSENQRFTNVEFTPEKMYEIADFEDSLVGRSESCAGSPSLIKKMIKIIIDELTAPSLLSDDFLNIDKLAILNEQTNIVFSKYEIFKINKMIHEENNIKYSNPINPMIVIARFRHMKNIILKEQFSKWENYFSDFSNCDKYNRFVKVIRSAQNKDINDALWRELYITCINVINESNFKFSMLIYQEKISEFTVSDFEMILGEIPYAS